MNTSINEDKLRELAYGIWETEGKPVGQSERHWYMALQRAEADDGTDYIEADLMDDSFSAGDEFALQVEDADYSVMNDDGMDLMNGLDEMNLADQKAAHSSRAKPQAIASKRKGYAEFDEEQKPTKARKSSAKKKSSTDSIA